MPNLLLPIKIISFWWTILFYIPAISCIMIRNCVLINSQTMASLRQAAVHLDEILEKKDEKIDKDDTNEMRPRLVTC